MTTGLVVGVIVGLMLLGWCLARYAALADRKLKQLHQEWLAESDPRRTWRA